MNLRFLEANPSFHLEPKELYRRDFTEIFDVSLKNAPNFFDNIEVEETYGSGKFTLTTKARVDSVINPSTGYKYGDDYKSFIFSPKDIKMFIGRLIKWNNNYWLAINGNTYESSTNCCIFRRCNNFLRWKDENGNIISEPCIIDYNIMEAGDYSGRDLTTISGFEKIWCQRNNRTIKIKSNQRFLFGHPDNPVCYKVYGDGIRNFLNSETMDNMSPSLIELTVGGNYSNKATDDFKNLIANAYQNEYSIIINQDNIQQLVGFETQLTTEIRKNNETINDKHVIWTTSDKNICSIDQEGNLKCLSLGSCLITAYLYDNPEIKYTINVNVLENIKDEYFVEVNAENYNYENYILQGDTVVYNCVLYKNAVPQDTEFKFELMTNAKDSYYEFDIIDGNHFKIKNKKMSQDNLNIICVADSYRYEYTITLKGAW